MRKDMSKLVLKPVVQAIDGGWVGMASLYQDGFHCATERFNAYDNKLECWNNAKKSARQFARKHNENCKCGSKMTVGSY